MKYLLIEDYHNGWGELGNVGIISTETVEEAKSKWKALGNCIDQDVLHIFNLEELEEWQYYGYEDV